MKKSKKTVLLSTILHPTITKRGLLRMKKAFLVFLILFLLLPAFALASHITPLGGFSHVLVDGDTIHIVEHRGQCHVLTADGLLQECTLGCSQVDTRWGDPIELSRSFTTPDGVTYGISSYLDVSPLYRWTPNADIPWEKVGLTDTAFNDSMNWFEVQYAYNGETLWVITKDGSGQWNIYTCNTATGKSECVLTHKYYQIYAMFPLSDGKLAYIAHDKGVKLYTLAPDASFPDELFTITLAGDLEQVEGFAANPDGGWYLLTSLNLYAMDDRGNLKEINHVTRHDSASFVSMARRGDRMIFTAAIPQKDAYGTALFNLSLLPEEPIEFIVASDEPASYDPDVTGALRALELEHSGVFARTGEADILTGLITGGDSFDVMALESATGLLASVADKGYYVDLSDVPEIKAFVDKLYPPIREAVMRDGKIVALPITIKNCYQLTYNKALWDELRLGEVPATYEALLDLLQREKFDRLSDVRLIDDMDRMRNLIEIQQMASDLRKGEIPQLLSPTCVRLCDDAIGAFYGDTEKYADNQDTPLFIIRYSHGIFSADDDPTPGYLPLSLGLVSTDGQERGELVNLQTLAINPHSKHVAEAKDFLRLMVQQMAERNFYALTDGGADGLEKSDYHENVAYTQSIVDAHIASMTDDDGNFVEDESLMPYLLSAQSALAAAKRDRWLMTPEMMKAYHEYAQHLLVEPENGPQFVYSQIDSNKNHEKELERVQTILQMRKEESK